MIASVLGPKCIELPEAADVALPPARVLLPVLVADHDTANDGASSGDLVALAAEVAKTRPTTSDPAGPVRSVELGRVPRTRPVVHMRPEAGFD